MVRARWASACVLVVWMFLQAASFGDGLDKGNSKSGVAFQEAFAKKVDLQHAHLRAYEDGTLNDRVVGWGEGVAVKRGDNLATITTRRVDRLAPGDLGLTHILDIGEIAGQPLILGTSGKDVLSIRRGGNGWVTSRVSGARALGGGRIVRNPSDVAFLLDQSLYVSRGGIWEKQPLPDPGDPGDDQPFSVTDSDHQFLFGSTLFVAWNRDDGSRLDCIDYHDIRRGWKTINGKSSDGGGGFQYRDPVVGIVADRLGRVWVGTGSLAGERVGLYVWEEGHWRKVLYQQNLNLWRRVNEIRVLPGDTDLVGIDSAGDGVYLLTGTLGLFRVNLKSCEHVMKFDLRSLHANAGGSTLGCYPDQFSYRDSRLSISTAYFGMILIDEAYQIQQFNLFP